MQGYDIEDFEFSNAVNNTFQWIINAKDSYLINKTRHNLLSLHNLTQIIFDMNNKGSWQKGY